MRHTSLRAHLVERAEQGNPAVFHPSNDPPLAEFATIFADTDLYSFDVNKHLTEDELAPLYELTAETVRTAGDEPELLTRHWSPVYQGQDPMQGFREGPDSAVWGNTLGELMPQDERTAAFMLLLTSNYVHLSASREQSPPLVRGAISEPGEEFRYVVLADHGRAR
jgi:hypothetical protein